MKSVICKLVVVLLLVCNRTQASTGQDFKAVVALECAKFINSDSKAVKEAVKGECQNIQIDSIKAFYKSIQNLNKKLDAIYSYPIDEKSHDLNGECKKFVDNAIAVVTSAKENKEYRKELPNYASFEQNLNSLIENVSTVQKEAGQNTSGATQEPASESATAITPDGSDGKESSISWSKWLPYLFSLLLLGFCIYLSIKVSKLKEAFEKGNGKSFDMDSFKKEIKKEWMEAMNKSQNEILNVVDNKIKERLVTAPASSQKVNIERATQQSQQESKKEPVKVGFERKVFYADIPDGAGFSHSNLQSEVGKFSVFRIEQYSETEARFSIVENSSNQSLILSSFQTYLKEVCTYSSLPNNSTKRINTETPGKLLLNASFWSLSEKCQISLS